jgi:hypothetical protein
VSDGEEPAVPVICPLCGITIALPAEGTPADREDLAEVMRAARVRLGVERVHYGGHPVHEWAYEVDRLRLELAGAKTTRSNTERDAGRIVAVLVKRLGGYAVLTVSELTAVDGRHLTQKRDAYGGLAFKVEG